MRTWRAALTRAEPEGRGMTRRKAFSGDRHPYAIFALCIILAHQSDKLRLKHFYQTSYGQAHDLLEQSAALQEVREMHHVSMVSSYLVWNNCPGGSQVRRDASCRTWFDTLCDR